MSSNDSKFTNLQLQKLTAQIVEAKQLKSVLSKTLSGCDKCRLCAGNDDLQHVHYFNETTKAYVCGTCVKLVKKQRLESLPRNEKDFCEVCHQDDGMLFIEGVTNNLCLECFGKIKALA